MKRLFGLLFTLSVLAITALAFAADPAVAPAVSPAPAALAAFLRDSVYPLLTAALLGLLAIPLRWLGNRFKIDYLMQRNNAIEQLAIQGISLAQEIAAKRIGSMPALTGIEKLDIAVSHVLQAMPAVSQDQAERIIQAMLAQIPGVGATKEQVVSRDGLIGISGTLQPIVGTTTASESGFVRLPLLAIMLLISLCCLAGCATTSPATPTQNDSPQVLAGKSLLAVKSTIVTAAAATDRMCTTGAMAADKCAMARTAYGQSRLAYDSAVDAYLLMIQGRDPAAFAASLQRVQSLAANLLQLAGGVN